MLASVELIGFVAQAMKGVLDGVICTRWHSFGIGKNHFGRRHAIQDILRGVLHPAVRRRLCATKAEPSQTERKKNRALSPKPCF